MIPPLQSLVKYDTPVLVSTTTIKKKEKGPGATARGTKKGALPPVEQRPGVTQTEDILNSILPPREWTEDGQLWVQYVSSTPATRLDVINLQEKLDQQVRPPAPAHAAPHPVLPRAPPPLLAGVRRLLLHQGRRHARAKRAAKALTRWSWRA